LDALVTEQDRRSREAEELRLAIGEIEAVAPQRGEDVELAGRAERLGNLEDLRLAAAAAHELLSTQEIEGGADVLALLDGAKRQLERVVGHDATLQPIAEAIVAASFAVA